MEKQKPKGRACWGLADELLEERFTIFNGREAAARTIMALQKNNEPTTLRVMSTATSRIKQSDFTLETAPFAGCSADLAPAITTPNHQPVRKVSYEG